MSVRLKWGILATGRIAATFARSLEKSKTGELIAVGSRTQQSADEFGRQFHVPRCYGSYEALLADKDVEAIYISTPHPMHLEWAIRAAQARKHIFCEKPIAMNAAQAQAMIDAAQANDVCLMEAFVYRCHPQTAKVIELLQQKVIGDVRMIQTAYGFPVPYNPQGRLFNKALGGGGILDVGCYPMSYTRLIAGIATGQPFADPTDLQAFGHIGDTGVDEWTGALCRFPGDIIAQITTCVSMAPERGLSIFGSRGRIHLQHAFHPAYWGGESRISVNFAGHTPPWEITIQTEQPLFSIAIDRFAESLPQRQVAWPGMRWDDTLGNMRALDRWRQCIGLSYDADQTSTR